jgi:hypothetical protein
VLELAASSFSLLPFTSSGKAFSTHGW